MRQRMLEASTRTEDAGAPPGSVVVELDALFARMRAEAEELVGAWSRAQAAEAERLSGVIEAAEEAHRAELAALADARSELADTLEKEIEARASAETQSSLLHAHLAERHRRDAEILDRIRRSMPETANGSSESEVKASHGAGARAMDSTAPADWVTALNEDARSSQGSASSEKSPADFILDGGAAEAVGEGETETTKSDGSDDVQVTLPIPKHLLDLADQLFRDGGVGSLQDALLLWLMEGAPVRDGCEVSCKASRERSVPRTPPLHGFRSAAAVP